MKTILISLVILSSSLLGFTQANSDSIPWHLLSPEKDNLEGIALQQAYEYLHSKKKIASTVVVAIIDSGIDTAHEDLEANLWHNPKEIPYNNIDDDGNGYIDDIYGWNFIGGADGKNIDGETAEAVRIYREKKARFEGKKKSQIAKSERKEFNDWKRAQAEVLGKIKRYKATNKNLKEWLEAINDSEEVLNFEAKNDSISQEKLKKIVPKTKEEQIAKNILLQSYKIGYTKDVMKEGIEYFEGELNKSYNLDYNPRPEIVKDNPDDITDTIYGNNDVMAVGNSHGTGVSGIIGAVRNNGVGTQGIVDSVKLMMIRVVPGADERDKDVALAIRYAVNNGAKIINCSFGKYYGKHPEFVVDAIDYAIANDVLIVHAAGNDSYNNDKTDRYPNPREDQRTNWIDVGASSKTEGLKLAAGFSCYGPKTVDIFAPGVDIYSTSPHNKYGTSSGTSDASPVVTGVAALLKSYYPQLTASQIRDIILESSVKHLNTKVIKPGTEKKKTSFKKLSTTGGIVNAYEAVKLAENY
jgi:subtilisin family serine protease